ncbi:MAG TPA: ubiquinol-cytochrome C chaperone family protein [Sphingomicrobium sp.]|nr:ubiquinol-cytochrome C chaperone family protein [Sphingomicrobium sp.]
MNSMLRKLFARLTPEPAPGAPLFKAATGQARQKHWYREGAVEDNVDGRFAMLATVLALITVRLEDGGVEARAHSAWLAERFVEAMDAEHRQMGLSDPALGKTVRRLVSALGNRSDIWREAVADTGDWRDATARSVYRGTPPGDAALDHSAARLRILWEALRASDDQTLIGGRIR